MKGDGNAKPLPPQKNPIGIKTETEQKTENVQVSFY